MLVIATSDGCNCADVSPRGGASGYVDILDDKHLYLPDRPGNNRLDSHHNILRFPFVGMLFFIPGIPETLRVNGRATIQSHADGGRRPGTGLLVEVSEVFLHCSVALELSHCWAPERWPRRGALASASRIWADHIRQSGNG